MVELEASGCCALGVRNTGTSWCASWCWPIRRRSCPGDEEARQGDRHEAKTVAGGAALHRRRNHRRRQKTPPTAPRVAAERQLARATRRGRQHRPALPQDHSDERRDDPKDRGGEEATASGAHQHRPTAEAAAQAAVDGGASRQRSTADAADHKLDETTAVTCVASRWCEEGAGGPRHRARPRGPGRHIAIWTLTETEIEYDGKRSCRSAPRRRQPGARAAGVALHRRARRRAH